MCHFENKLSSAFKYIHPAVSRNVVNDVLGNRMGKTGMVHHQLGLEQSNVLESLKHAFIKGYAPRK